MKHNALYTSLFILLFAGIFISSKRAGKNNDANKGTSLVVKQSYLVVNCDSCKIVYQTPGKKQDITVTGVSPNLAYDYSRGKTLKANIYALNHDQNIVYTVYNRDGRIIYDNTLDQPTGDPWDVDVLLP